MRAKISIVGLTLAACSSQPPPAIPARTATTPPVATATAPAISPPPSRDVSAAWLAALEAKDATAIEGMLALPFTLYYDDNWTGKRPAECDPVRVVREVRSASERKQVVACITATVRVSPVAHASDPIGIWDPAKLIPALPAVVRSKIEALSADHVFVRGPSIASGDFDFTVAVPRTGDTKAHLVVLWTING